MANTTIGEVARRAGLRASAIRYYEKIDLAKRAGFRVDEVRHLFHGFGKGIPAFHRWQVLAQRKITEMDDLIASAKKMKRLLQKADRCKCLDLEDCGKAFLVHPAKKA